MENGNETLLLEFKLLGVSSLSSLQALFFLFFLIFYISTLIGNTVIIYVIWTDDHLHKPMYFFLANLSVLEISYTTVIVPKMLESLLHERAKISFSGCMIQLYVFNSLGTTECLCLAMMAYDRYAAICKALRYGLMMTSRICQRLIAGCWIGGLISSLPPNILISRLPFCGSAEINHFFCDAPQLLDLSCVDTSLVQTIIFAIVSLMSIGPLVLTVVSYINIISAILKRSSTTKRQKVFSTCASHLIVVIIFYGTVGFIYLGPNTNNVLPLKKIAAVLYTVVTPLLNPLIYTLRNREIIAALKKAWRKHMD